MRAYQNHRRIKPLVSFDLLLAVFVCVSDFVHNFVFEVLEALRRVVVADQVADARYFVEALRVVDVEQDHECIAPADFIFVKVGFLHC